ncbi:MAG TPA: hypothetical protein VF613_08750 [Longimicrobium sp.]|jgi:hypothetical protein
MTPNDKGPNKRAKVHTTPSGVSFVKARDVLQSENGRRALKQSISRDAKGRGNGPSKKG